MDKTFKKILELILVIAIIISTYFYEDIEEFIKDFNTDSVGEATSSYDNLEIYFLDVGNADSILIRYHENNILIDAGNNGDGNKLVNYFKELGINKFKYVIGTHAHEDHIGGMDDIINNFKINHFYMPSTITTTKTFEDILDSLDKNSVKFETPEIDHKFKVEDLNFRIIYIGDDKEDLNKTSIILKMTYKNTSYLFTGDTTSEIENQILDKNIESTVLKVAHHGSQYSSSAKFLNTVKPQYAIIEVGKNNDYGHPKDIVLKKLNKVGAKIYRTDRDKTIHLISDGENIKIDKIKTDTNGE